MFSELIYDHFPTYFVRGKKVSAETQNFLTLFSFRSDGTLLYAFVQKFKKTKKGGPIKSLDPFYFLKIQYDLNNENNKIFQSNIFNQKKLYTQVHNVKHFFLNKI